MSPSSSVRQRKTALPTGFYLIASIALFVFMMVFFIDLVTAFADMVSWNLSWSDFGIFPSPILTERMVMAVVMVILIIMFFWSLDLVFTGKKRKR